MSFRPRAHFSSQRLCGYFTPINYKTCQFVFGRGCFSPTVQEDSCHPQPPPPPQPLIKKASLPNDNLKNYCLVSGLCFMSKLVKRVVVKQLMQHINSNNLDKPHWPAYKTGHSYWILKMRSIRRCRVVNLRHLSYLICRPPSIQSTMILFWNVLSHGLVCVAWP